MEDVKITDVVLVEDNPGEARLVISAFKKCNPDKNILWINDGKKALEYLLSGAIQDMTVACKKPLLVLLDLSLPKINGIELIKKIQESRNADRIEIVVITGSQKETDRAESYAYGVKTYMKKDIVCDNCIKLICGDEADRCVAKAFNEAYE